MKSFKNIFTTIILSILFVFSFNISNAQSCIPFTIPMNIGSIDNTTQGQVTRLQSFLNSSGLLGVNPTGYFGQLTSNAVKQYQASKGLETVGNVGPLTRQALTIDTCNTNNLSNTLANDNNQNIYTNNQITNNNANTPNTNQKIPVSFTSLDETVTLNIPAGSKLNLPTLQTRAKYPTYTFAGWYTDSSYTQAYLNTPVISSFNLYAKWVKSCNATVAVFPNDCEGKKVEVDNTPKSATTTTPKIATGTVVNTANPANAKYIDPELAIDIQKLTGRSQAESQVLAALLTDINKEDMPNSIADMEEVGYWDGPDLVKDWGYHFVGWGRYNILTGEYEPDNVKKEKAGRLIMGDKWYQDNVINYEKNKWEDMNAIQMAGRKIEPLVNNRTSYQNTKIISFIYGNYRYYAMYSCGIGYFAINGFDDGIYNIVSIDDYLYHGCGINMFDKPEERNGYTFVGWYDNSYFDNLISKDINYPKGNSKLYAKWIKTCQSTGAVVTYPQRCPIKGYGDYVVFNGFGNTGKYYIEPKREPSGLGGEADRPIMLTINDTAGYYFDGFYSDRAFTVKVPGVTHNSNGKPIRSSIAYIKWAKNCSNGQKITFPQKCMEVGGTDLNDFQIYEKIDRNISKTLQNGKSYLIILTDKEISNGASVIMKTNNGDILSLTSLKTYLKKDGYNNNYGLIFLNHAIEGVDYRIGQYSELGTGIFRIDGKCQSCAANDQISGDIEQFEIIDRDISKTLKNGGTYLLKISEEEITAVGSNHTLVKTDFIDSVNIYSRIPNGGFSQASSGAYYPKSAGFKDNYRLFRLDIKPGVYKLGNVDVYPPKLGAGTFTVTD